MDIVDHSPSIFGFDRPLLGIYLKNYLTGLVVSYVKSLDSL